MKLYEKGFLQIYVDDDRVHWSHDRHCERAGSKTKMGEQKKEQI